MRADAKPSASLTSFFPIGEPPTLDRAEAGRTCVVALGRTGLAVGVPGARRWRECVQLRLSRPFEEVAVVGHAANAASLFLVHILSMTAIAPIVLAAPKRQIR